MLEPDLPEHRVITVQAGNTKFSALVADTTLLRRIGLSGRDTLPDGWAMRFDMVQTTVPRFWMRDMRFSIDMVWVDEDFRVAAVTYEAAVPPPETPFDELPRYGPGGIPVRYVLEIGAGLARDLGISPGDVATLSPAPGDGGS